MEYSEEAAKQWFLEEVARLKAEGAFLRDEDFCKAVGKPRNFLSELQHPNKRRPYLVSVKVLNLAWKRFGLDIMYCVTGERKKPPPGPVRTLKSLSLQGAHLRRKV